MKKSNKPEDQSKTEIALKVSEQRYRTTIMSVGDGVIATDTEGRVEMMNPVAEELTGWKLEEASGKSLEDIFHIINEDTRQTVENPVRRVMREGIVVGIANHSVLIARDSTEYPIADSGAPIRNEKGDITGVVLIFRDQTQERTAQKALQERERKFRETVKYLDEGYYSVTTDGLLLDHNQAFNRILGIDIAWDMKGAKLPDFWQNSDDRKVYLQELMTRGSIMNYLINAKKSDGEKIIVMANAHLVKDENGRLVRIEGTFTDFTELRRAEIRLVKLNRIYSFLSDINQAIVRTRVQEELFKQVCSIAVEQGGLGMAWIGLIEEPSQRLKVIAQAGRSNGYHEQVNILLKGRPLSYCPIDSALRQGEHFICKIIENKEMAPCQKVAYDLGFRSSASFPLKVSDILKGALTFYSDEPDFFDEAELKLLDELALDISFAMEFNEKENIRLQAEKALNESEEHFRTLFENSTIGIYRTTPDGKILLANPILVKLLGYSSFEELSKRNLELDGFEPSYERSKFIEDIESKGEVKGLESAWTRSDGEKIFVSESAKAIRNIEGSTLYYDGIIEDITERKNAEEALKVSEEKFKNVFEFANAGKSLTSINGEILVNRAFRSMVGYTKKDLVNIKWKELTYPDDIERDQKMINSLLIGGRKYARWEKRYIHKNGQIVWVDISTVLQRNRKNEPLYFITTVIDITDKKRAEEKIIQLNNELEQKVIVRTSQLEAANKELEAFAYSVSHDLRAPLRAIDGFSKFVLDDYENKLDSEGKRLLLLIRSNTKKMDQLITDLLALSRITRCELNFSGIDMTQMAISMFKETTPDVPDKISLKVDTLPEAYADPTYMRQVWTNLIANAIKFSSKEKKPSIKVCGRTENGFNVYYVKDNGVGFNPEYAHKLFGVFQRLHKSDDFEGTGVGLAIVQRIIHRHGGKVWAEGEESKGATFYFSLPVKKSG